MKSYFTAIIILVATLALSSCATILTGPKSKVTINSNLSAADKLSIDKKTYSNVTFPYKAKIKNGGKTSYISARTEGYEPVSEAVDKVRNGQLYLNILFGGIPGMIVDGITGSAKKVSKNSFYLNFRKEHTASESNQTTIINNYTTEAKPVEGTGNTALESTIIRWYVVSAPAGADVQWRVVSSTPDVKNTNQSFLGSTPYESTGSFDIMGLTYNNSGNVQIEISCEKIGYITQRKRFNIRQAIDQKEISTKFNLIKED